MAARRQCSGLEENGDVVVCRFNPRAARQRAVGKFDGKCFWCSPTLMQSACENKRARRAAARALASLGQLDEETFTAARGRIQALGGGQEVVRLALEIRQDLKQRPGVRNVGGPFRDDDFKEMAGWFEKPSVLNAARRVLGAANAAPEEGGPILILQKKYWKTVVSGEKTMEIRGRALQPMRRHVGHSGEIWGAVVLGPATRIATVAAWKRLAPHHHWNIGHLPYKVTYAHPIFKLEVFDCPILYMPLFGQVGNARYRPPAEQRGGAGHGGGRLQIEGPGVPEPAERARESSKRKKIDHEDRAAPTRQRKKISRR